MPMHKLAVGDTLGTFLSDPGASTFFYDPAATPQGGSVAVSYSDGSSHAFNANPNGAVIISASALGGYITSVCNTGAEALVVTTVNDPMTT